VASFGYTHLAFAFAGISSGGLMEPYNGSSEYWSQYTSFNSLKTSNPGLKTLIAVGGWTFDQGRFVYVSSTEALRVAFANSVVSFLESTGFDGIDLDWE
jgi:chitinase